MLKTVILPLLETQTKNEEATHDADVQFTKIHRETKNILYRQS